MPKSSSKHPKKDSSQKIIGQLVVAVVIGFLLTVPFFITEAITTSGFVTSGFPLALFNTMWVIASLFMFLVIPFVMAKGRPKGRTLYIVLRIALILILARMWIGLVIDQWPCFLGATGC